MAEADQAHETTLEPIGSFAYRQVCMALPSRGLRMSEHLPGNGQIDQAEAIG